MAQKRKENNKKKKKTQNKTTKQIKNLGSETYFSSTNLTLNQ